MYIQVYVGIPSNHPVNYGYIGLFLASFLASTILPFGSEGILVFLVYKKFNIPALVLVASAGNYLGACTSYYMGLKGRSFAEKYLSIDSKNLEKAALEVRPSC